MICGGPGTGGGAALDDSGILSEKEKKTEGAKGQGPGKRVVR